MSKTIKKHEDKYIHIPKDILHIPLRFIIFLGLLSFMVSIITTPNILDNTFQKIVFIYGQLTVMSLLIYFYLGSDYFGSD